MLNNNTIPLFKVAMHPNVTNEVTKVLNSGYITQGPKVDEFERELREYWNVSNVVTVNSCTSAIHLAFHLIKNTSRPIGNRVLASPLTCAAGIFPILANGFKITWCDIDDTLNIDLDQVWKNLDHSTQILTFVHWGGTPIDYDKLAQIKRDYEKKWKKPLFIVEDCAHALNSYWDNKQISTIMPNNFKCYSFQAIKHLTTGDGGALVCPTSFYKKARKLRWFGLDRDNKQDFRSVQDIKDWGFKFHMNDVAATIGIENIKLVEENMLLAKINASYYDSNICPMYLTNLEKPENSISSNWLYTIIVPERSRFISYMKDHNIECNQVHVRNDYHTCLKMFSPIKGYIDYVNDHMVSIPVGFWVSSEQSKYIVEVINNYDIWTN